MTLRGGGLFVVDVKATPMAIVGEYDNMTVRGNGCGGAQVGDQMYINSGGSPVNVSGADPHHPALYGFDVYRLNDVAEVIDVASGKLVRTVNLNGRLTDNAAPDLVDIAPQGTRLFVALRGPTPLSGDPHIATGSTPGLGVIQITEGGRNGSLMSIVPMVNPMQQPKQHPDAHGIRVRPRR